MAAFLAVTVTAGGILPPSDITTTAPVQRLQASTVSTASSRPEASRSAPTFGMAIMVGGIAGASQTKRKATRTVRNFFGGSPAPPPPKKATSYKDFEDPWLGSCDLGFDPLNLCIQNSSFDTAATAVPETTYYNYRESEVKHGRFAMAAFLAVFFEAADRDALLQQLGNKDAVDNLDATLGLDELQAPVLLIALGYQALAEYNLQKDETDGNILSVEYKRDRCPGDLGFDPAGMMSVLGGDKKNLHNVEVNLGRLAMIGLTVFLYKEFLIKDEEVAQKLFSDSAI